MRNAVNFVIFALICVFLSAGLAYSCPMHGNQMQPMTTPQTMTGGACPVQGMQAGNCPVCPTCPGKNNILGQAQKDHYVTFVRLLGAAGGCQLLQGCDSYTFFAPDDNAFSKMPAGTVENLMQPQNKAQLVCFLQNHIVKGTYSVEQLVNMKTVNTIGGQPLTINKGPARSYVNNVLIKKSDIYNRFGVVHVIEAPLTIKTQ